MIHEGITKGGTHWGVFASHVLERAHGKALQRGWHHHRRWLKWACKRRWGRGVFVVVIRRRVVLVDVPIPAGGGDEGRGVVVIVIRWRGFPFPLAEAMRAGASSLS